jgi:hypothetical protein
MALTSVDLLSGIVTACGPPASVVLAFWLSMIAAEGLASRDGENFVIAFQPEDMIVFRHSEARALRKACVVLRWEVVSDTVAEANDPASW